MVSDKLQAIREKIDAIDAQLVELLNRRARCVIDVAEEKQKQTGSEKFAVVRPEREAQLLRRAVGLNNGPLSDDQIEMIFHEIISMTLTFQQEVSVAYLGPVGTYSHSAALKQFGHSISVRAQPSIHDVFHAVESDRTNYGVVPVENSSEGAVNQTLDCFIESDLNVCAEINLPIHHALMAPQGLNKDGIRTIYSHEQSLAQCRNWIRSNLPTVKTQAVASNAEAARLVSGTKDAAAIAGEPAAAEFELNVLETRIEDRASNATRFFVLGKQHDEPSGDDKTSILVYAANRSGSLVDVLSPFKKHDISLTRVISRPAPSGNWSYVFFIDFDGHQNDEVVATVLGELRNVAFDVKLLGSYPRAI